MATWIRQGVRGIERLCPEAKEGFRKVGGLFRRHGRERYITSGDEGTHIEESYHYSNRAWDERIDQVVSANLIRQDLNSCPKYGENSDFDVVDKNSDGTPKNCVHIEFDPK